MTLQKTKMKMNEYKQKESIYWCMVSIPLRRGDRQIPKYQFFVYQTDTIRFQDTKLFFFVGKNLAYLLEESWEQEKIKRCTTC